MIKAVIKETFDINLVWGPQQVVFRAYTWFYSQRFILTGHWRPYAVPEIEPQSAICKTNTLLTTLLDTLDLMLNSDELRRFPSCNFY